MKDKKAIFLVLISCIVVFVVVIACVSLSQLMNMTGNNGTPVSAPVSSAGDGPNVIVIGPNDAKEFINATIAMDDTIILKNSKGDKFIIELEQKHWKNIQWSTASNLLAVLGETKEGIFDIYIYNISTKSWSKATDYSNSPSGVDSYRWLNDKTIYYTQGTSPERWIHKFDYLSKEIVKMERVDGVIDSLSPDKTYIVAKYNNVFTIYNLQGTVLNILSNVTNESGAAVKLTKLLFNSSNTQMVVYDTNDNIYKLKFGAKKVIALVPSNGFNIMCNISENAFLGYNLQKDGRITVSTFSIKDGTLTAVAEGQFKNIESVNTLKILCSKDLKIFLPVNSGLKTTWLKILNGDVVPESLFENVKEISINGF